MNTRNFDRRYQPARAVYDATAAGTKRRGRREIETQRERESSIVHDGGLYVMLYTQGSRDSWGLAGVCEGGYPEAARAIEPSWMSTEAGISADWFGLGVIRDVISGVTPHAPALSVVYRRYEFAFLQCPPTDVDPRTLAIRYRAIISTRPRMFLQSRAR